MPEQRNIAVVLFAVLICLAPFSILSCKKKPVEQTVGNEPRHRHSDYAKTDTTPVPERPKKTSEQTGYNVEPSPGAKRNMNDVIQSARRWEPVYFSWYGKTAPEFTLTDLDGKTHKLSDYRGKDVILVFWTTWCPPCRVEIPDLIALRNRISRERLAIWAITNENPDLVGEFASFHKMNYTILLDKGNMPAPFGVMRIYSTVGIPGSFFVDPEGKVKLATSGTLSFGEIKAILNADWPAEN
jgi:peroxiredoxin